MNVFIPYQSPIECAKALWADQLRYNKQIIECQQIIASIEGAKAWRNHPVCLMYKEHKEWLFYYMKCFENYREYMKSEGNNMNKAIFLNETRLCNEIANFIRPSFLDNQELLDSHKSRLYTKSPNLYPQFAEYGTSEVNWYCVNGEILKYVNGKRIKE